jgi:hypothetical protein
VALLRTATSSGSCLSTAELRIGGEHFVLQISRHRRGENGMAHLAAALLEVVHVGGVQRTENLPNARLEAGAAQEMTIAFCRDGKAIGHLDALGTQLMEHLPQRGVLATHERNVANGDVGEPADELR